MNAQKQSLYNVSWQCLRVRMLGGWTTVEGTQRNIAALRAYLQIPRLSERHTRLWRVLNLLNAVRMGNSGQGKAGSEHDQLVRDFRDQVSAQYKALKAAGGVLFVVDSDTKVLEDWRALPEQDRQNVLHNLRDRSDKHKRSKHREELNHFINVVEGV